MAAHRGRAHAVARREGGLEQTDHHLLVGQGRAGVRAALGFKIEDDLNTEHSRKLWLEWKRRIDPEH